MTDFTIHATAQQQIKDILSLCLTINQATDYAMFFDFSGHVNLLQIRVRTKEDETVLYKRDIWLSEMNTDELTMQELEEVRQALKKYII